MAQRASSRDVAAFLLLGALLANAACSDVTTFPEVDPHAPVIANVFVEPAVISVQDDIVFHFDYADAAGDITLGEVKDVNGGFRGKFASLDKESKNEVLFDGAAGRATVVVWDYKGTQEGPHLLRFRLKDAEGSFSNVLECSVYVRQDLDPDKTVPPNPEEPEPPPEPPPEETTAAR